MPQTPTPMPTPMPEPAQALLVLGGEDPQHCPRSRTALHYYWLCHARGQALPCVVVSGAGSEAQTMTAFLLAGGVAPTHLLQEPLARSTLANVVLGGVLAARHGLQRVALVSDDFHLQRALRLYQRVWGCAPAACLPSGERGSAYLRLRETLVFALQISALRWAGVPPGNWRAHVAFVSAATPPNPPNPHPPHTL